MSVGVINTPTYVPMTGLSARTTNAAAALYTPFGAKRRDVGYVTSERKTSVWVWNGTGSEVTLTAITTNDQAEGISTTATPPDIIPGLSSLRVDITITASEGPLAYEALLTFLSACQLIPALTIVGTRAPHLSGDVGYLFMPHNWEKGLDEQLSWQTGILTAHDGTEQRIRHRTFPRRTWDLRLLVAGAARRKLEAWLGHRKKRYLFAPVWRDLTRTLGAVPADSSVIPVETEYLDFAVGRWVALFSGWDEYEIRTVTGVGPNYIAVDAPFQQEWPEGTMIAPCRYCLGLEGRRFARFTEEVADYLLRFEAQNESLMPAIDSPEVYRSIMVCPITPSWTGDSEGEIDNNWLRLDNETGLVEYDIRSIEPIFRRDVSFLLIGRARIDLFLRFLFACAGRLVPFWLPSTAREFELVAAAGQDDTNIIIESIDYGYSLSGSPARSHIEMVTTDGVVIRRMLTGIETLPDGSEKLMLDNGLPQPISAATLNRCAWLELVRFDSDEIDLHWATWECLEVTMPIVVLP